MGTNHQWFWCCGCHRAFRARVGHPHDAAPVAGPWSLEFSDMWAGVVCPFRDCRATHVMPWSVMCRAHERHFGESAPARPRKGARYELRPVEGHMRIREGAAL